MESRFFREMPRWPIDTWKDTIASDKKTKTYVIPVSFITLLRVTIISKGSDRCWGVSVWRRWNLVLSAEVWSAQGDRGAPCERIPTVWPENPATASGPTGVCHHWKLWQPDFHKQSHAGVQSRQAGRNLSVQLDAAILFPARVPATHHAVRSWCRVRRRATK